MLTAAKCHTQNTSADISDLSHMTVGVTCKTYHNRNYCTSTVTSYLRVPYFGKVQIKWSPTCINVWTQKETSTHTGDPFAGLQVVKTQGSRPNLHSDEHPEYYTIICDYRSVDAIPLRTPNNLKCLRCSPQTLQANRGRVPESRPQRPSSTISIIHYSLRSNHSALRRQRP